MRFWSSRYKREWVPGDARAPKIIKKPLNLTKHFHCVSQYSLSLSLLITKHYVKILGNNDEKLYSYLEHNVERPNLLHAVICSANDDDDGLMKDIKNVRGGRSLSQPVFGNINQCD